MRTISRGEDIKMTKDIRVMIVMAFSLSFFIPV
jgi:hypothetical protein